MVLVSSTASTRRPATGEPSMRRCRPCALPCLADDEGVEPLTRRGGGMQHRRGNRVGAEGQAADRVEVPVGNQGTHHPADDRCRGAVQGDPAQVDVVVGGSPRGQRDLACVRPPGP